MSTGSSANATLVAGNTFTSSGRSRYLPGDQCRLTLLHKADKDPGLKQFQRRLRRSLFRCRASENEIAGNRAGLNTGGQASADGVPYSDRRRGVSPIRIGQ
jgi:hypothetical protein